MTPAFDFSVNYLGLKLKNPFIVASSGLTSTLEGVKKCENAGAGAVVLKSIFEEQLNSEAANMAQYNDYPEAADYLNQYVAGAALTEYLELISQASAQCAIPVIASINCSSQGEWSKYAKQIESAGAAALELNIFLMPSTPDTTGQELEAQYLDIAQSVLDVINIPLTVKLSTNFTSPLNMVQKLCFRGVKGVTLFNRFYTPDININKESVESAGVFSTADELGTRLRWIGLASSQIPQIDIAVSGGVHTPACATKALLCGAKTIQLCTTLYKNGVESLANFIEELEAWALSNEYSSVSDFACKLNPKQSKDHSEIYERAQFMRYFSNRK